MPQDILIKSDNFGLYDLQINGSDFASAAGFETVIPVSYFSDARASAALVQDARKRRGWVVDTLDADGRETGSLLWLLDQARITQDTINLARTYAQAALQHLVDDNVAANVVVSVEQNSTRGITILTTITSSNNEIQRYVSLWKTTDFKRIVS
jgi:phage gp46-like protein